jgi:hypothetical protein
MSSLTAAGGCTEIGPRTRVGGKSFKISRGSSRLCVAVGIPGGGRWPGFPTGVGRSGGGWVVVRSFPCPVRFHSRGGRPIRLRARGLLSAKSGGSVRVCGKVPGVPRAVPGASADCFFHLRGRIFRPPPPLPPAFGSALSRMVKAKRAERNSALHAWATSLWFATLAVGDAPHGHVVRLVEAALSRGGRWTTT